ncbi:MAG TPA: hypothetical protein VGB99_00125 [Acidobacteriota bacterium]
MRRVFAGLVFLLSVLPAPAHDPKSTAPRLQVRLGLGHGQALQIEYLALHWNPRAYRNILASDRMLRYKNASLFGDLGTARFDVAVVLDGTELPAGEYQLGFLLQADGSWRLRLEGAGGQATLATRTEGATLRSDYLTIALIPAPPNAVWLEAACGPHQTRHRIEVPFLTQHHE